MRGGRNGPIPSYEAEEARQAEDGARYVGRVGGGRNRCCLSGVSLGGERDVDEGTLGEKTPKVVRQTDSKG